MRELVRFAGQPLAPPRELNDTLRGLAGGERAHIGGV
jgi:hypothetical protein